MTIYQLKDKSPTLPSSGHYWIAPNAALMGDVELGKMQAFGMVQLRVEILKKSPLGRQAIYR